MTRQKIKIAMGTIFLITVIFWVFRDKNPTNSETETPQKSSSPLSTTENTIVLGKSLYHIRGCVQCHGDKGRGDGRRSFKKKMKIKPGAFEKGREYKNGLTKEGIRKTLTDGIQTDGVYYMPRYWYLQSTDMDALAEYVLSLSELQ